MNKAIPLGLDRFAEAALQVCGAAEASAVDAAGKALRQAHGAGAPYVWGLFWGVWARSGRGKASSYLVDLPMKDEVVTL